MCTSLLDPKMDFIFKSIFGNEKEKSVLLSFLNSAIKSESPLVDVELIKFSKDDPLSGWGMFLKEPSSDIVEEAEETVKEIKLAKKKLYVISSDEDEREKYRMREKSRLDAASALATAELKGIAKGEKLAKLEIAKSLLGLISDELIAEKTGLSIKEIDELK